MAAARDNLVPMFALWLFASGLVFAYYRVPGCAELLTPLARGHQRCPGLASFLNLAVFCGFVPGLFFWVVPSLRPSRPVLTVVAQSLWCGLWGMAGNGLYMAQCHWFGDGTDWGTLLLKTAIDQFVWTPFVLSPLNAAFFFWLGRDFSFRRSANEWPRHFVRAVFLPNLVSNWLVWLPVLCVVYAFPPPLQVHLAGVASAFWTLLCLRVGKRSGAVCEGPYNSEK